MPSTLTIPVRIKLTPTVFSVQFVFVKNENKHKEEAGVGPFFNLWAVVVAQLVELSPPPPEIRGLNPVIGKHLSNIWLLSTALKRQK